MSDHYRTLGVARSATDAEIRRAYLRLAREHHPDRWAGADPRVRARAEVRMREVNAAWAVLGDASARAAYDRTLGGSAGRSGRTAEGASARRPVTTNPPRSTFRPIFEHDEDDDDTWRYEPDRGVPDSGPGRLLTSLPIALFLVGLGVLVGGGVLGAAAVVASGLILMALSLGAFVLVPMVVMARAGRR